MADLNQLQGWAEEAVQMAREDHDTVLDYSRDSVVELENVLHAIHVQFREGLVEEDDVWERYACRFGAYLGETLLRNDLGDLGYCWGDDYDGEPCLIASDQTENVTASKSLPITKCNKRLLHGADESVINFYVSAVSIAKGGDTASVMSLLNTGDQTSRLPEPAYVRDGWFDANAACWLLYSDITFFLPAEIEWDGEHHWPTGMQVNAAKMREVPTLLSNIGVLNGMLELLVTLDEDDGLRVPLSMIHPALHDALRHEDMTGITLFNLQACAKSLIVKETTEDEYQVICDGRLAAGIPAFYQLVSRMVWDMRTYNKRSGTFKITFLNARNLDADQVLGQVDRMVPGALSQPIWPTEVIEEPQVELPSGSNPEMSARIRRPFASGFDDPLDIQADEELFEAALNQLAREFPIVRDIEGTHHMGRIPRIEHVRVGDPLVLASDWKSPFFDPVCIEVFNAAGETLGNLREAFSATLSGNRELACLLPYVTARVETVTPKSKRRSNAKYALMDVIMEIDSSVFGSDGDLLPEAIERAKELLALPKGKRVSVSIGNVSASELRGNIDVSEAVGAPSTSDAHNLTSLGNDPSASMGTATDDGRPQVAPSGHAARLVDTPIASAATPDAYEFVPEGDATSEPTPDYDGILADVTPLRTDFNLQYGDRKTSSYFKHSRALRQRIALQNTFDEIEKLQALRAQLAYAILKLSEARADEERERAVLAARREAGRRLSEALSSEYGKGEGYVSLATLASICGSTLTPGEAKRLLDEMWLEGAARRRLKSYGMQYASPWSDADWNAVRDEENGRLLAAHKQREESRRLAYTKSINNKLYAKRSEEQAIAGSIEEATNSLNVLTDESAQKLLELQQLRDTETRCNAEVEAIAENLSQLGLFAFGKKRELTSSLEDARKRLETASQSVHKTTKSAESLVAKQRATESELDSQRRRLRTLQEEIASLKTALARGPEPREIDATECVRSLMKLWGCPVTPTWCAQNVVGVKDEKSAQATLQELVDKHVATITVLGDTYAIAD